MTSIQERLKSASYILLRGFVRSLWKLSGTNRFYEVELTQNSKISSSSEEVEFSDENSDESPLSSSPEREIEHESDSTFASPLGLWSLVFKTGYHMQRYTFGFVFLVAATSSNANRRHFLPPQSINSERRSAG